MLLHLLCWGVPGGLCVLGSVWVFDPGIVKWEHVGATVWVFRLSVAWGSVCMLLLLQLPGSRSMGEGLPLLGGCMLVWS